MEPTPSAEDRLSALEQRVAELEAAANGPKRTAATQKDVGETSSAGTESPASSGTAGSPAEPSETGSALPGDNETFWALHGLVDHLGEDGGVTYTGYTTPPGGTGPVAWQMGLSSAGLAQIDFAEAAGSLAALGHPVRLQLLQEIYEGTCTVAELGKDERFGTSGQIYHHVHALAGAGWLESARRGHWRVPAQRVVPLLTLVLIGTH
ncbi:ArsR family transcriptional regulator [Brevibacterium permense]|uniref:ArsR/SmtB family transcription factor n=1 Tax=Brevibacterium permense TaxID=234834 RepID=UPI0021D0C891|nr:winged helix-turn-helix domain-containing protein [Brevibacterium permense]MCU4297490.1 ArsR family transcriptional regulator [Brevibacterium permense]